MNSTFSSIAMYSTGLFLTKATSLFMLPFLTHSLHVDEIGRLEFLASISAFAGLITGLAMYEALYRFVGESDDAIKRKSVAEEFYSIVWLSSLFFLPFILLVVNLVTHSFPEISISEIALLVSGVVLSAPLSMTLVWLRIEDKVNHFVTITIGGSVMQIVVILLVLNMNMGVAGVLLAAVISHLLQLYAFHLSSHFRLRLPNKTRARQALKYSLPIAFSGLIAFGLNGAEKWLIALTSSLDSLAAYAISAKLALAMCILVQPFNMWWMGKRFGGLKNQGDHYVVSITHVGIVWIFILATSLLFAGPLLISIALPESYSDASLYLIFPLSCAVMKETSELVNIGLLYRQQSQRLLYINIQSLCIGAILVVLLWNYSIWGILIALLVAQSYKLYSVYTTSQSLYPLNYKLLPIIVMMSGYFSLAVLSTKVTADFYRLAMATVAPLLVAVFACYSGLLPEPFSLSQLVLKVKEVKDRAMKQRKLKQRQLKL